MTSGGFDWNDLFNGPRPPTPPRAAEVGVRLHGHQQEGRYYVRASDVADLLDANHVLPTIAAKLRKADA